MCLRSHQLLPFAFRFASARIALYRQGTTAECDDTPL